MSTTFIIQKILYVFGLLCNSFFSRLFPSRIFTTAEKFLPPITRYRQRWLATSLFFLIRRGNKPGWLMQRNPNGATPEQELMIQPNTIFMQSLLVLDKKYFFFFFSSPDESHMHGTKSYSAEKKNAIKSGIVVFVLCDGRTSHVTAHRLARTFFLLLVRII